MEDTVQENSPINAHVVTVSATDADADENGRVLYSIDASAGNASALFGVEPDTGRIVVKQVQAFSLVLQTKELQPISVSVF